MRIHYLSSSVLPSKTANSIHVMKMCRALGALGHTVELHAFTTTKVTDDDIWSFYGIAPQFDLKCYLEQKIPGMKRIISGTMGKLAAREADIVLARNLVAAAVACSSGVNTIFEAHTPINNNPLARAVFGWMIRHNRFDRLIVITHTLASWFIENFPSLEASGKIQVLPDAADPMPLNVRPWPLANKGKRLQVGYIGHLYAGKGMELVSVLPELCPWADFSVVGGMDDDVHYWKQRLKEVPNLAFYGHRPHSEATRFLASFDVVLLPNQRIVRAAKVGKSGRQNLDIGRWTSPLKMFEYMAAGKPIVASDLTVLREVLRPEENAILCPPEDIQAWVNALDRLCNNHSLRNKLGQNALRDFKSNYTWDRRAELLLTSLPVAMKP